ncbi:hypothetical protein T08_15763 [Trichinella sp. T8]|nr:hypothetical protein T08_15763 [Trichinella sp. T8]
MKLAIVLGIAWFSSSLIARADGFQSHEVLDYASIKADILHIQTSLDKLTSLEQAPGIAELLCRKPTSRKRYFFHQLLPILRYQLHASLDYQPTAMAK